MPAPAAARRRRVAGSARRSNQRSRRATPCCQPTRGAPAGRRLERAGVAHVVALVADPPVVERELDRPAEQPAEMLEQREQAYRIARPAAEVEGPAGELRQTIEQREIGRDRVVDIQDVAHLLAVAVDGERLLAQRRRARNGRPSPGPRCRAGAARRGSSCAAPRSAGRSSARSRARIGRRRPWSSRRGSADRAAGPRRCRARAARGRAGGSGRRARPSSTPSSLP